MSKRQKQRRPRQYPTVMLLTLFAVSCLLSGTLGDRSRKVCYGSTYEFPPTFRSTLGKLYFTPSSDGSRKLLMENGEVKDPRFSNSDSLSLRDVRHIDDGTYTFYFVNDVQIDRLRLSVKDCAESQEMYYMDSFRRRPMDFEYVEFSRPGRPTEEKVVWNRTGSNAKSWRARVINSVWEIRSLTPEDDGYYNFRRHDKSLVTRIKLSVQAYKDTYTTEVGEDLHIAYPGVDLSKAFYTVTFTHGMTQMLMLMEEGQWVIGYHDYPINQERYLVDDNSLTIESITMTDEGTFEFRDGTGYMILTVEVTVMYVPTPDYVYYIIASIFIFLLLLCCCCVRKRCCKKGSSKGRTDAPRDAAAAPAVYYHDTTQNSGPTYSTHPFSASPAVAPSSQPLNPVIRIGGAPSYVPPDTTPLSAPTYPAHAYSASPAVAPPYQPVNPVSSSEEGPSYNLPITAPVPSDCLSSDTELRFELKGMTFPSALPLSSDSTTTASDVYTSDKLNFL